MAADELVSVKSTIQIDWWSDGTISLHATPDVVPTEFYFNAAATIARFISDKGKAPIEDVMEHLQKHVDQAKALVKQ